jgi:hypothetical protein
VLILSPLGEPGQVLEHLAAVGMEDVRPVLMNEHTSVVIVVEGVAPDVIAFVDDQNFFAGIVRQPLRHDAAGEAGSNDEIVKHPCHPRTSQLSVKADATTSAVTQGK